MTKSYNTQNIQSRNPGADLLRIVSMLMILTSHIFVHGKVLSSLNPWDANFHISWLIESCCYVMVNCFVLITGYFLCTAQFRLKKLLLLWGQIIFTSSGVYLILCASGAAEFSLNSFLSASTPVTGSRYWFATSYIILYMLSPLLNWTIARMDRRAHFIACTVLCGVFVVLRNITFWSDFANLHGGYSYNSFIVLYFLGSYLRKYPPKKHHWILGYFALSAVTAASRILMTVLYYKTDIDSKYVKVFMQYNSVTVVAASVCLFLFFVNLRIESGFVRKLISFFSPLTFGVYLIHEQKEMKEFLWPIIEPARWAESPKLFIALPVTVIVLFLGCSMADFIRRLLSRLLKIPYLAGKISAPLERIASDFINRFTQ